MIIIGRYPTSIESQPVSATITTSSCRQGRILLTQRQHSNQLPWASDSDGLSTSLVLKGCSHAAKWERPRHERWVVRQVLAKGMQCTESKHDYIAQEQSSQAQKSED